MFNEAYSSLIDLSYDKIKHVKLRTKVDISYPSNVCSATKTTLNVRKRFPKPHRRLYELLYSDLCKMPVRSIDGFKYYAPFLYDPSRFCRIVILQKKSNIYRGFAELLEDGSVAISTVRTDHGSEYLSQTFRPIYILNVLHEEFWSFTTL